MLNYDNQEAVSSQNSFVKVSVFEFFLFPGASFLFALNASIKTNKSVVNEGRKLILIPHNREQVINHFQRIPIPREVDDSERLPSRVSTSWAQLNFSGLWENISTLWQYLLLQLYKTIPNLILPNQFSIPFSNPAGGTHPSPARGHLTPVPNLYNF